MDDSNEIFVDEDDFKHKTLKSSPVRLNKQSQDFNHLMVGAVKDARNKLTGLRQISNKIVDKENVELINKAKKSYSNHLKQSMKDEKLVNF